MTSTATGIPVQRKEKMNMISKREFFEICPQATEEDYKVFLKQLSDIEDKMWEEDHPLDD